MYVDKALREEQVGESIALEHQSATAGYWSLLLQQRPENTMRKLKRGKC